MAYTTVPTITTGDVATAAWGNTYIRNNLRYLKGEDGVPTIQNGLIINNALGTEYLQIPSLTTTQRDALTPVNGMVIYNSTLTVFQRYEAGAWVSLTDISKMVIASQAQGDIFYASSATAIARLGAGTSGWFLKTQGVGANPIWAVLTSIAIGSGSYTGDDTANRAIAHGLGIAPKIVFVFTVTTENINAFIEPNLANIFWNSSGATVSGAYAVTAPDATNFYVGNAGNYLRSGNGNTAVYRWIALA